METAPWGAQVSASHAHSKILLNSLAPSMHRTTVWARSTLQVAQAAGAMMMMMIMAWTIAMTGMIMVMMTTMTMTATMTTIVHLVQDSLAVPPPLHLHAWQKGQHGTLLSYPLDDNSSNAVWSLGDFTFTLYFHRQNWLCCQKPSWYCTALQMANVPSSSWLNRWGHPGMMYCRLHFAMLYPFEISRVAHLGFR